MLRYGHMVQEYLVGRSKEVAAERRARLDALRTRADAEKYVRRVRDAFRRCFAPFPERTPVDPRVTGRDEFAGYILEKIVFESRPGFLVTGNLYLPKGPLAKGQSVPGVLGLCGHSQEGKACANYQAFSQGLALKGFAVFIIDPISQGERRQFYPADGQPVPGLCPGHNLLGNQMALNGEFFGTWRVWDALRALDVLAARPEVDETRLGVTGNSGGGTLTSWVTALDPRLTIAAPSCHTSTDLADLENELPRDAEQSPPRLLAEGLDLADALICHAPRPTLVLAQYDDFFDERAARQAFADLQKIHRLLGSRSAEYFAGPQGHGYGIENREAMYAFFLKHARLKGATKEKGVKQAEESALYCLPGGETKKAGSRRVFEFTAETARALAKTRGRPTGPALLRAVRQVLTLPAAKAAPHYRMLCGTCPALEKMPRQQFAVETEPGIQALVTMHGQHPWALRLPQQKVCLYVGHESGLADVEQVREAKALLKGKTPLLVVDPRGIGETRALTCRQPEGFFEAYGSDYLYAAQHDRLGESYFGRRVFDLLRVIDCLLANGVPAVELVGRGLGSLIVTFAALLHPSRPSARIFHYLPSYQLIAETPVFAWPLSALPRGVLKHFDLPDVYRALGTRLKREQPWGANFSPERRTKRKG